MDDRRTAEGVEHLQTAARELLSAARAFLDVVEEVVEDPERVSNAAQGVSEQAFIGKLDDLAMRSYEDQCAPANPRMPMLDDMKALMTAAYYGTSLQDVRAGRTAAGEAEPSAQETVPVP